MLNKFFYLSSVERKALYDTHLMHTLVNLILLENLLMNRSAMAYWKQVFRRLLNNWPALRSPKVAASPTNEKTGHHLGDKHLTELGKNSLINEQKIQQQTEIATPTNSFTMFEVSMPENTINEVNMTDNTIKEEEDKNNLKQYRFNPTKEPDSGIFHKDEYISPTDTRVTQRNEKRENQTETATELPKIIVVQPIQDPS